MVVRAITELPGFAILLNNCRMLACHYPTSCSWNNRKAAYLEVSIMPLAAAGVATSYRELA